FDVDWLYEDSRESDFSNGLEDWSTFRYFKGIVGHCGYNRQDPELLVAHPDKEGERVLKIGYTPNDTLVEDRDGAVWNFPAAKSGEVTARIQLPDGAQSIDLILNDRWFNPTDSVAKYESQYKVALDRKSLKIKDAKWHDVTVRWTLNGEATIYVDGKRRSTTKLISPTIHGVSYLHLLGGTTPDEVGVLIESVRSKKIN
ncbi:MAG: exo-alpha-sialidase, partial [Rikenellaceae bacterium]